MKQLFFLVIPLSKNWYRTGDTVIFTLLIFSTKHSWTKDTFCSKILFRLGDLKPLILANEASDNLLSNADRNKKNGTRSNSIWNINIVN